MSPPSSLDASFVFVENHRPRSTSPLAKVQSTSFKKEQTQAFHPSKDLSYWPGSTPSYAHDWSPQATGGGLKIAGRHFVDGYGRVCSLRGVNLSGSCKTPVDHDHNNFPGDHRTVTFVGRPFPLEEAHEHFSRLRRWGLTFIRFLVTWEAVEHEGPGIYDLDYLAYIRSLLGLLPQYGLTAFVSLHQDVWSRYCGGSGAPAWTLECVGFDLHAIEDAGAAWLHGQRGGGHVEAERGLWPCGYQKLSAATMATLFWAGDIFAPKLLVKNQRNQDVPIQQFLQGAFLDMWAVVAQAVGDLDGVLGFQIMNEPHRGYINVPSLHSFDYNTDLHLSHVPSAFESFQLGAGHPTLVSTWTRSFPMPTKHTSHTLLNTSKTKAWRPDGPTQGRCLWEYHDVWRWNNVTDKAVPLRENYFRQHPDSGRKIEWYTDLYFPFAKRWAERVRNVSSDSKLVFLEPIPNEFAPDSWTEERRPSNMVFAPHWYDLNSLFNKAFGNFSVNVQGLSRGMFPLKAFYWGQKGARENFTLQIRNIVENGYRSLGEMPVIIGECGIPMDMNKGEAFKTGNFIYQMRMMDAMLTALEKALIGFTLWNYNPYNNDERGDDWNGENFSWFSRQRASPPAELSFEQTSAGLDEGARILPAIVRPYPAKTAGIPLRFDYEMSKGSLTFEWANPEEAGSGAAISAPGSSSVFDPPRVLQYPLRSRETEIFMPAQLTRSRTVVVGGLKKGDRWFHDAEKQTVFIVTQDTTPGVKHKIVIFVLPSPRPAFVVNDVWSDYGLYIRSSMIILLAIAFYFLRSV
ncbi:glycoside hydrolase family 5 protein [Hypholoma sublateritium FD-334 SS-4]|uniref:Glycoside hydrolase family 5 protein n=1 Tax=Hypholoma sublateritium (strain FD-334 SS-4) TaxID=945553 RepID=A0A0D2MJR1_HYPSF|nr:glycoside hydrolase family 5 protein [Hypholoma sublateritium FD-334 SS-4]